MSGPFFSPDGQWVAYFSGGHLKKVATSGGSPLTLCAAENPFGATWLSDGMIVYGQPGGVRRVSSNGGTPEWIMKTGEGEVAFGPQVLPGGGWLLLTVTRGSDFQRWDTAQIVAHSLRSQERKVLWTGGSDARYVPTGHLLFAVKAVLFAVAFDLDGMAVSGQPVPVVRGVHRPPRPEIHPGYSSYGVSDRGTLVHVRAADAGRRRVLACHRSASAGRTSCSSPTTSCGSTPRSTARTSAASPPRPST